MPSKVLIVTGPIGCGKTTRLKQRVSECLQLGQTIAGILSPGRYQDGYRKHIDVAEPHTGHRYLLATRANEPTEIQTPNWSFDPEAITRANHCLQSLPEADILVIDELGPLEFNRSQGFTHAFEVIGQPEFSLSIVVVRESLVSEALKRWPQAEIELISQ